MGDADRRRGKVCERANCLQRAVPPIGRAVAIDQNRSTLAPYPVA
ncbi:short-chain fatty acyl-CoA regulator family protein [Sphingopyxis sp.]|nr:short-chain fatty acyl-CoA regulator family protein [Sphingopyxis sp.]HET6526811.1 short-chain fatty acyl-CoA regulator family protein [Sphingopyxis sp.]